MTSCFPLIYHSNNSGALSEKYGIGMSTNTRKNFVQPSKGRSKKAL